MGRLLQEFRLGLRTFRRSPSFTLTAVGILAIGLGMAAAMFTVFDRVLLQRLPVQDQSRLVVLWTHRGDPALEVSGSFQELHEQFRPESRTLAAVAGVAHWGVSPTPFRNGDAPLTLNRTLVSGNFFEVLGTRPALGRLLRADDDVPGGGLSLVLSHRAWLRYFSGDSTVVGRTLGDAWSERVFTIVGVAPAGLDYPIGVEAWTPPWSPQLTATAIARLAPGATPDAAREEFFRLQTRFLPDWRLVGATVHSLEDAIVGDVRPTLIVLAAAAALLFALTCFNLGNLLLLRAGARGNELRIRRSLGATGSDVIRHVAGEQLALAIAGGAIGVVIARVLLRVLVRLAPDHLPRLDAIEQAGWPLAATALLAVAAAILSGLIPAVSAVRGSRTGLRVDTRSGGEQRTRSRARQLLVGSQVALALVLLAGAALLTRSLERLTHVDLGFRSEHLAILQLSWPSATTAPPDRIGVIGDGIVRELGELPGVSAVSPVLLPPFLGANVFHGIVTAEGAIAGDEAVSVPLEIGDEGYFRAMDIPILRGRGFEANDREHAPPIAVVSASVAQRLWPGEDPIGKRIHYWDADSTSWRTVVGVAGDIRYRSLREATPTIFLPRRQTQSWQMAVALRTQGELAPMLASIRDAARRVEPGLQVWSARSMDGFLDGPLAQPRLGSFLLSALGGLALLLAAIGLYAVMAAAVRERTHDIGVRMALGATPGRVRREVLRDAMLVVVAGLAAGIVGAFAGTKLLASLLYEIAPGDPVSLAGAMVILVAVALAAAYLPARRATRIDPVRALRAE